MPLKITPASVLLTTGQAVTLQATETESAGNISWTLTPPLGTLFSAQPTSPQSSSATYVAPLIQSEQTVAITAVSASGAASTTIALTPDAVSIMPASVELHARQKQQFAAIVASGLCNEEKVTWVLAPMVGTLDQTGLYTAPDVIPDNGKLSVTAVCADLGKQISATITLTPEPWRGRGPILLAGYLTLIFLGIYLMIGLWPSQVTNVDQLKAAQLQAQIDVDKSEQAIKSASSADPTTAVLAGSRKADLDRAEAALTTATNNLNEATAPAVNTIMVKQFNREIDLLCLILLAGAVGSFLHMAQSFSDFAGNRTLKSSWLWWYYFLPFVGSGLALALYAALRGGLITVAATSAVRSTDLNPYGLVAGGILAGLFSKQATSKLGEIFDTVFQSSSRNKDRLNSGSEDSAQTPAPGATGSNTLSNAEK